MVHTVMTANHHFRPWGFRCASTARVTASLLLSFLAFSPSSASSDLGSRFQDDVLLPPGPSLPSPPEVPSPAEHTFSLRNIYHHGTHLHPGLHRRRDVVHDQSRVYLAAEDEYGEYDVSWLKAKSRPETIQRLVDRRPSIVDPMVAGSRQRGYAAVLDASAWTMDQVSSPDIKDKDTVLTLAIMTANAYVEHETDADWEDVGERWNRSADFGWESDGLRGHVFVDDTNSTIIIGLKGTTTAVFDGEGTTTNDKVNDNLFFSCCCAQQGQWTWHQVCDCATGTYSCNNTCVVQALREENRYYGAARELYSNVTELYPDAQVWLTGHSLGGAVASMLGMTYGLPVVTFEAVPEALPASRLGLPVPPGASADYPQMRENTGTFHFGHNADPVYIGTCNGATASCTYGGYAMETTCHAGYECMYDVVTDKGWRVGIGTHRIRSVIDDVIKKYNNVPECKRTPECRDCAQWKMYESNGTETTTTTSPPSSPTSTRTRTRTSTCETPGWWGCLDKTTPATTTTTASTTSSSTSTCKTPGWFGCKDKTASVSITTTTTEASSTTTCHTPGRFWGCRDDMDATTTAEPGQVTNMPVTAAPTGAVDDAPSTGMPEVQCAARNWLGLCRSWTVEDSGFAPDDM